MTWFWFVLFGIIALVARKSIAGWVYNWGDDALKHMSTFGLIGFGIMATFGVAIPADAWPLHIGAALGGILGFFAVSETVGRKARAASLQELERGRRQKREQRDRGEKQPGDPKMRWQDYKQSEPEPVVRTVEPPLITQEPPLITDQDSPANILELLERASAQWENPETAEPVLPQEPEHESYQSVAQIIARAAEQKEVIEGAVEVIHVPVSHAAEKPPAAEPVPAAARETAESAEVEAPKADDHYQPGDVKLAGTPVMKAAKTLSADSAIARKSGPVKLGRSLPLRPPGPLSLGSTKPGPMPMEARTKAGGFHYEPMMVSSRLGKQEPPSDKEAPEKAAEDSAQPEDQAASPAPAAELQ